MAQSILSKEQDFIVQLPEDIRYEISKYLSVRDIFSCRMVLKTWVAVWPMSWVHTKLVNRYFRVAFEGFFNHPFHDPIHLETCLKIRILQRHNRQQGPYKWMALGPYIMDKGKHIAYHDSGKAFAIDEHTVRVATCSVVGQISVGDHKISRVFLSNDLLVVLSSSPASLEDVQIPLLLHIWQFKSLSHHQISIPSKYQYISLYDNQVAISMEQQKMMVWMTIGRMNICNIRSPASEVLLFHPTLRNTFMIVSKHIGSPDVDSLIVVNQYTCGKHTNISSFRLYFSSDDIQEWVELDVRPIDENGLYSLCWVASEVLDNEHACVEYSDGNATFHHILSYDVYEKTFMIKCFYGGTCNLDETNLRAPLEKNCLVWEDQMFKPYLDIESNSLFFQTVWSFKKILNGPVPYILENGAGVKSEKDDHDANGFRISLICKLGHESVDLIGDHADIKVCGDSGCVKVLAGGSVFQLEELTSMSQLVAMTEMLRIG